MEMKKKILAGILTGAFVFGSCLIPFTTAEAAENTSSNQKIERQFEKDGHKRPPKPNFNTEKAREHLAKISKLDKAKVQDLLKDGYRPHDIIGAGVLANKSGKNVNSVLNMKKINNRWSDVAKSLGVDWDTVKKEIMPKRPHHKGDKRPQKPQE